MLGLPDRWRDWVLGAVILERAPEGCQHHDPLRDVLNGLVATERHREQLLERLVDGAATLVDEHPGCYPDPIALGAVRLVEPHRDAPLHEAASGGRSTRRRLEERVRLR